jgi:hypothetical protein
MALARLHDNGEPTAERLLVSGHYLMHLCPRCSPWPANLLPDETLADLVQRLPEQASNLLDFTIAFGTWEQDQWTVERSTRPEHEGHCTPLALHRVSATHARVSGGSLAGEWQVLEWTDPP